MNKCFICKHHLHKIYRGGFFGKKGHEVVCRLGFQPNLYCISCDGFKSKKGKKNG